VCISLERYVCVLQIRGSHWAAVLCVYQSPRTPWCVIVHSKEQYSGQNCDRWTWLVTFFTSVNYLFYPCTHSYTFYLWTECIRPAIKFLSWGLGIICICRKCSWFCAKHPDEVWVYGEQNTLLSLLFRKHVCTLLGSATLHQMNLVGRCSFCLHQYMVPNSPMMHA
jgi:hypothetical protein